MYYGTLFKITRNGRVIEGYYMNLAKVIGCSKTRFYQCAFDGSLCDGWKVERIGMPGKTHYKVTDLNGNVIIDDTIGAVSRYLKKPVVSIKRSATNGQLLNKKYYVEAHEVMKYDDLIETNEYESLKYHLKEYGNTISRSDPRRYQDRFKMDDLDIEWKIKKDGDGKYYIINIKGFREGTKFEYGA